MMRPGYLVDTDWAVFYLRGREPFVSLLRTLRERGLAVSIVTVAELYEGVFRAPRPEEKEAGLFDFLSGVSVLDLTVPVARLFGSYRAQLRREGRLVGDFDLLIGCTAVHHSLPLLTENAGHYERIPGLRTISARELSAQNGRSSVGGGEGPAPTVRKRRGRKPN